MRMVVGIILLLGMSGASVVRAEATSSSSISGADTRSDHAPRVYGITAGASYVVSNRLPLGETPKSLHPWGGVIGGRMGWQVGGLSGGPAASIGFEMDLMYQSAPQARASYGMIYGLFVKHAIGRELRVRPYLSYGLGAAQMWIDDTSGRGIGHATRIAAGVDARLAERKHLTFAFTYQLIMMPRFALPGAHAIDTSFHSIVLSTGFWYGN